jgi:voltage-gated potassium channel
VLINRLVSAGLVFGSVFLVGGLGYRIIGQGRWDLSDCLYMAIVTLSTVGFAETLSGMDEVPGARVWTVALILLGSGTLLYFASTLTAFLVEGDLRGALRRQRMARILDKVHDHVIVVGLGATGNNVIRELRNTHTSYVAIERNVETAQRVATEAGPNFLFVVGDAADDHVLIEAGVERAKGLVAALSDDRDNLFVTITARALNDDLRIVARCVDIDNAQKLERAGADKVISPALIGGMRMASEMIRPTVVSFLDAMVRDKQPRRIEEIGVPSTSAMVGRTLAEANLRQSSDALVMAIRSRDGEHVYNPGPDATIEADSTLILMVRTDELARLRRAVQRG